MATGLLNVLLIVLTVGLCQASHNASVSRQHNDSLSEQRDVQAVNKSEAGPLAVRYAPQLSRDCSGTLRGIHGEKTFHVALPQETWEDTARQICEYLSCGGVYNVSEGRALHDTGCLTNCSYQDTHLENCTLVQPEACTRVTEIICGNGAIQLEDGGDRCAGRVELWHDRQWGTVCDDDWDLHEGHVVCAQLGCGYALSVTGQGGAYKPGRGPVYLDNINCTGAERSLWDCQAQQHSEDCGHKEDAGVVCSELRAVRLTGGLDRCSGKVEIHRNGTWGTVCDTSWAVEEAGMVCSMLGCGVPVKFSAFERPFSHGNATRWYYFCLKTDSSLWQCREFINPVTLCRDSGAAALVCSESLGLPPESTPAPTSNILNWTTGSVTLSLPPRRKLFPLSSPILGCIALSLALLLVIFLNSILCRWYKRKYDVAVLERNAKAQTTAVHQANDYRDRVDLVRVTSGFSEYNTPPVARPLLAQSSMDNSSFESDYEHHDPNAQPIITMSTFQNSLRNRADNGNPVTKTSALYCLPEEGPSNQYGSAPGTSYTETFNKDAAPSEDSFESSSTSSEECYKNTGENGPLQSIITNGYSLQSQGENSEQQSEGKEREQSTESDYDDIANYRQ